jgi:hypothetical protein
MNDSLSEMKTAFFSYPSVSLLKTYTKYPKADCQKQVGFFYWVWVFTFARFLRGDPSVYFMQFENTQSKMNKHTNQDLFESYNDEWHQLFFDIKSDGYLVAHKKHGLRELPQNIQVGLRLARLGECVELLPDLSNTPSADATRNGEIWEIKTTNGSYRSVQNRLRKGRKQSRRILLVMPEIFEHTDVLRGLLSPTNTDKEKSFEIVDLLLIDDKIIRLDYEEVKKRDFKKYWAVIS